MIDDFFTNMSKNVIVRRWLGPEGHPQPEGWRGTKCKRFAHKYPHKRQQPEALDPWEVFYSIAYPEIASVIYGPNIVVFRPSEQRSVDVSEFRCASYKMRCCDDGYDSGEILTPGYGMPNSIVGFELRYSDASRKHFVHNRLRHFHVAEVHLAFYKHITAEAAQGHVVDRHPVVMVLAPVGGPNSTCIAMDPMRRFVSCQIKYRRLGLEEHRESTIGSSTAEKWPCQPERPESNNGSYVAVKGALYIVGSNDVEIVACSHAEHVLSFHGVDAQKARNLRYHTHVLDNLLRQDPSLRLLESGQKCADALKAIVRPAFLPLPHGKLLPTDAPPGFALRLGLIEEVPYFDTFQAPDRNISDYQQKLLSQQVRDVRIQEETRIRRGMKPS